MRDTPVHAPSLGCLAAARDMSHSKKKSKQRKPRPGKSGASAATGERLNNEVLTSLNRLGDKLSQLDDEQTSPSCPLGDCDVELAVAVAALDLAGGEGDDTTSAATDSEESLPQISSDDEGTLTSPGPALSHWRTLPLQVQSAYQLLSDGADYIHATSTKYTLVAKVDAKEGGNLALELRKGAELVGAGTLLLFSPDCGSSRSLKRYTKQFARAVISSTVALVKSFVDGLAFGAPHDGNNIGAQRTGAVWAACDNLRKVLPRGNRAAMRRELMVWVRDCSESIEEFGGILELGPRDDTCGGEEEGCMTDEDQFTESEMDVARAAVNLMKCSKNVLALVLKACESAGDVVESFVEKSKDGVEAEAVAPEGSSSESGFQRKGETLQCISNLHELGRTVGEGVTNFGVMLYPPLENSSSNEELIREASKMTSSADVNDETDGAMVNTSPLSLQLERQLRAISECIGAIEELRPSITEEVRLAMERLRGALEVRRKEIQEATTSWSEASNLQPSHGADR